MQTDPSRRLPGMYGKLSLLVLVVLIPLLVVQAGIYTAWYFSRWIEQETATLDTAREVAATFEAYTGDVHRQELAIGAALTGPHPYSTDEAANFLTASSKGYSAIRSWNWITPEGRIIASNQPKNIGLNVSDRAYFHELRDGRPWIVSGLLADRVGGDPMFVIATRIERKNGRLAGMVVATVSVADLGDRAVALYHTVGEAIALFDPGGQLVFNSQEQRSLFQDWRRFDTILADAIVSGEPQVGVLEYQDDGESSKAHIAARVPIRGIGWVAGARRPVAQAMASVYGGLWIAGALNLLVAVASGALAWTTSRRLINPLSRLQSHAQAIGQGDYAHVADSTGIRELAELATAFNHMQQLVQQRTRELEAANLQLQAVFDVANVGLLLIDGRGIVQRVNSTVSKWFGKDLSMCVGGQPGNIIGCVQALADPAGCGSTPECQDCRMRRGFESVLQTGQPVHDVETEVVLSTGGRESHLWLEISADPVALEGKPHVIVAMNNVTARKKAEKALESMASFPRLNPNPVVELDLGGHVHYVNPTAEKLFPDIQQLGLAHPWLVDWDSMAMALRDGEAKVASREVAVDTCWYRQTVHYVKELERVRLYGLDITDRKQAEESLKRTAEQLTRSNQELEQFAYVASHDLQEPLRVVTGYVQLVERKYKGRLDATADEFFAFIVDGVARMQQLIVDLLNYSRVGTHGAPLQPVDMQAVLDRALANLSVVIEENGASVTHDPLPSVLGDEPQLVQVLQNLIGNGIKFRSEQPPHIHISASRNGSHWQFAVRDNGIGIDRQYWDQIFVIFQRLHTRHKYPGTGIGLAICKRIVDRHNGRIWLESEPGQGTAFHFTLSQTQGASHERETDRNPTG